MNRNMPPRNYIGILDGSKNIWGVRLPDTDGCIGGGATPEAAIADVTQALRDVLAHKQSSGVPFPKRSSIADILKHVKPAKSEITVIIPVVLDAGRSVRANLTMDAGLLEAVDTAAANATRRLLQMLRGRSWMDDLCHLPALSPKPHHSCDEEVLYNHGR